MLKTFTSGVADHDWTSTPARVPLIERLKAVLPTWNTHKKNAVEDFINNNGGVLTDSLEREISRRFGSQAGN